MPVNKNNASDFRKAVEESKDAQYDFYAYRRKLFDCAKYK